MPENPNYFAISLKLRLTSLTGTFTREKIFIAFNVFLHSSGLLVRPSRWAPRITEEKSAVFNPHRCRNEIFIASFYSPNGAVRINPPSSRIKIYTGPRKIPLSRDIKIPILFFRHADRYNAIDASPMNLFWFVPSFYC